MKHLNQDIVLAVLDLSDPIEAAMIRNRRISLQALNGADDGFHDVAELGFGAGEAVVWMSPAIIAVCKWVIDVGQSTVRDEIKEYFKRSRGNSNSTAPLKINPEILEKIRDVLLTECKRRKMDIQSAEKAADALVKVVVTRPELLGQLVG